MNKLRLLLCAIGLFPGQLLAQESVPDMEPLRQQVATTERAFARSMADRDLDAFTHFLADEAVFFTGTEPLRGKTRVLSVWKSYFEGPTAPFSWEPDSVEVLESGILAFSSGPVYGPDGQRVATFHSVWRRGSNGEWQIVFDKGSRYCE